MQARAVRRLHADASDGVEVDLEIAKAFGAMGANQLADPLRSGGMRGI